MRDFWKRILGLSLVLLLWIAVPLSAQAASSSVFRSSTDETTEVVKDYSGKDLTLAEFINVKLENANFKGADLRGAVFNGAVVKNANLQGIDFTDGIAYVTDFSGADLTDAVLTSAVLLKSNFKDATIAGADFSFAVLDRKQIIQLCQVASGVNPVTGVETRESLECR